jgi:hypothetical protein
MMIATVQLKEWTAQEWEGKTMMNTGKESEYNTEYSGVLRSILLYTARVYIYIYIYICIDIYRYIWISSQIFLIFYLVRLSDN